MSDANPSLSLSGTPRRGRGPIGVRAGLGIVRVDGDLRAVVVVENTACDRTWNDATAGARWRPSRDWPR